MKRKLKIAQIAPLWYSLPPKKYSGIERIAYQLTEELIKKGHDVTLFASGDSKTSARLISIRKKCLSKDKIPWTDTFWELENLSFAFEKALDFDIIHCHVGLRALFFQKLVATPALHTFHNPLFPGTKVLSPTLEILKLHGKTTNACFISRSAKNLCPVKFPKSWVVYNGIDLNLFQFNPYPKDYFLWAGRIEKYKGIENAIRVAELNKIKLFLVGKLDKEREKYFKNFIKPHLSRKINYLGEVSQKELADLYRGARALLYPIEWHEPFGLIMAEAQACGTPIIVFKLGSAAEVVRNEKTGFVVPFLNKDGKKNLKGLTEALKNVEKIDREDCRKWAEKKFTIKRMVEEYEKIYYQILKKN
ncbi:MAG: glycosyltransferase family 4 protein [Parcubacteria group bacterium]